MIVETSAVLAILYQEADAGDYARAIAEADSRQISAVNFVEAAVVVDRQGDLAASQMFDLFLRRAEISVEAVSEDQARVARQAYY